MAKVVGKKVAENAIERLKEVRTVSTMKTASFSDEVKETTRLWRSSWITEPLDYVIGLLEKEIE